MNISQTLYEFQRSDGLTIRGKLYARAGEIRQPLVIFGHAFGAEMVNSLSAIIADLTKYRLPLRFNILSVGLYCFHDS